MPKRSEHLGDPSLKSDQSAENLLLEGLREHQEGRLSQAAQIYQSILDSTPDHFDALQLLGTIALQVKKHEQAADLLKRALGVRQDFPQTHNNLGIALQELGQLDQAIEHFSTAVRLVPDYAEAFHNRAIARQMNKGFEAAVKDFDVALSIEPSYANALTHRGLVHQDALHLDLALQSFDQALVVDPSNTEATFAKALVLLLAGRLQEGWIAHESRWFSKNHRTPKRSFSKPMWSGEEPLDGKVIFVFSEQGLGDTIQFCRYLPMFANLGVKIVFETTPTLHGLIRPLVEELQLLKPGDPVPEFDFFCPLMSLPLAFKTTLDTIPRAPAYLKASDDNLAAWEKRLGPRERPRVGVAWSGNPTHNKDRDRSIPMEIMFEVLSILPFEFVSLQKDVRPNDEAFLLKTPWLRRFDEHINDFEDTAALCCLVDVVISVDTSVAHLAGALGCQTWILLANSPDWRWLTNRSDSPWYPSVTLMRQEAEWDWGVVLKRVSQALLEHEFG